MHPGIFKEEYPPKRSYVVINFTGNNDGDERKMNFAQVRIREILSQNDTLTGVHFLFGDSSKYGTFIRALDVLQIEGARRYIPDKNNLWFYHVRDNPATAQQIPVPTIDCYVAVLKPEKTLWERANEQIACIWNSSWQLILGFPAFIASILILRKTNRL